MGYTLKGSREAAGLRQEDVAAVRRTASNPWL